MNKTIVKFDSKSFFIKNNKNEPKKITNQINSFLKKNDSLIGIGLYGEKRNVYRGSNYVSLFNTNIRRNIHLGIDIFTKVNTNLYSPLSGKVVILKNNSSEFDYGPTVVLEHIINKKFSTIIFSTS